MNISQKQFWLGAAILSGVVFLSIVIFLIFSMGAAARGENGGDRNRADQQKALEGTALELSVQDVAEVTVDAKAEEISPKRSAKIRAIGDMMLDRTVYLHSLQADDFSFPFLNIADFLLDADLTVGNLEGAITDNKSIANGTGGQRFYFTFSPRTVEPLTKYFDVVSFANNHAHNFGADGLFQSRTYLDESGLTYFGDPNNDPNHLSVVVEKNDIIFGFVGFHELVGFGFDDVIAEVEKLRPEVDVLIAYPHWGHEYITTHPSAAQKAEGHELIDAGVDIVIGAHPHVIQPIEIYNDKVIFYSLGNFIFDQYFSEETQQSLAIEIMVEERPAFAEASADKREFDFDFNIIPIRVSEKSQPELAGETEANQILNTLSKYSIATSTIQDQIKEGYIDL
ncbi:CapA family protein [Candidatus Parcubacteria bacterium]|jgi:gamma-polyglutamate biosynthesis protein CapA|nr:CapA family protein [Candidatus Parcubacteria bacterium]MBT3948992.1 CapA family protein [Candidatus Parcubacteria bacterium]